MTVPADSHPKTPKEKTVVPWLCSGIAVGYLKDRLASPGIVRHFLFPKNPEENKTILSGIATRRVWRHLQPMRWDASALLWHSQCIAY